MIVGTHATFTVFSPIRENARINQASILVAELSVNPPRIYIDYYGYGSMMYADGMGRLHLSLRMSTVWCVCTYVQKGGGRGLTKGPVSGYKRVFVPYFTGIGT